MIGEKFSIVALCIVCIPILMMVGCTIDEHEVARACVSSHGSWVVSDRRLDIFECRGARQ
jgi:hypothetical protein